MAEKLVLGRKHLFTGILLCALFSAAVHCAADVSLQSIIRDSRISFSYDPFRESGYLNKGTRSIGFGMDVPFLVVDHRYVVKISPPFRNDKGDIIVSNSTRDIINTLILSASEPLNYHISTIIIDPGHGGKDPGTIGTHTVEGTQVRLVEKDIVLDVSKMLYERLVKRFPDKDIILTRDTDIYLELEERTAIANNVTLDKMEAMLFVSIHANASLNRAASGFEVWYLPPDYRREVLDPSHLDDDKKDLAPILNSMMEEEITVESILLARKILNGMDMQIGKKSINRGLKEESWFVVRNAKMPSVLVELGFVTNRSEMLLLADSQYLKQLTEGIYNGLVEYTVTFDETGGFTR